MTEFTGDSHPPHESADDIRSDTGEQTLATIGKLIETVATIQYSLEAVQANPTSPLSPLDVYELQVSREFSMKSIAESVEFAVKNRVAQMKLSDPSDSSKA